MSDVKRYYIDSKQTLIRMYIPQNNYKKKRSNKKRYVSKKPIEEIKWSTKKKLVNSKESRKTAK